MTDTPEQHPTEITATAEEIVLMNEAGRAAMDALYILMKRDTLGATCAFLSIMQMALARSKLAGPDALAVMQEVLRHNFGPRYQIAYLPPNDGEQDEPTPPTAVH